MEQKKLIKILIIASIVLIILIIIENAMRGTNRVLLGISKKYNDWKTEKEYLNSEEYREEKQLEGIVGEVEELLKSSDLDKTYDMTNKLYLDYKFDNDRQAFNEYMSKYIGENISLEFQSYENRNGMYSCTVVSHNEENDVVWNVLIIPENEDNTKYSLIFDNLNGLSKIDISATNQSLNLKSTIKFVATAPKTLIFVIENENVGKNETTYEYNSIQLIDTSNHVFELSSAKGKTITIKPGEKTREIYRFMNNDIFVYPKKRLSISLKSNDSQNIGEVFFDLKSANL